MLNKFPARPAESFEFREIIYTKSDWVARVTINRPEAYNAYTTNTVRELAAAFKDAMWDDSVAVVVLTGAGDKAFCTGGDVKEYAEVFTQRPRDYWKWMGEFIECHDLLRNIGKPTIARINGLVAGGGNEFNMSCDLAVMADHATIRQVGTRVGSVAAGGATQWLPIIVGDRRARELLLTCEPIDAATALDWGLVNRVVPSAQLDSAVDELTDKLIDKFPECTRYTKTQVNYWKEMAWAQTIRHAQDWLSLHFATTEPYEGMTAFVEKRKPRYRELRARAVTGAPEFLFGPYALRCSVCGTGGLPSEFEFCGKCGSPLNANGETEIAAETSGQNGRS
jgi:enoyl-CoA hydratase/carnithine racemase